MQKLQFIGVGLIFISLLFIPFQAGAEEPVSSNILISEIQTGTTDSASEEFVELYNPTDALIKLEPYRLEYKSATGKDWFSKVVFDADHVIQPRGFFLISSYEAYSRVDIERSLRLAGSGGHLRLQIIEADEEHVLDTVGWGTADSPESESAAAPEKSESISRLFDQYGTLIDTDNNQDDFTVFTSPRPDSSPPLNTEEEEESQDYKSMHITELLVDPAQPKTDRDYEFIELFNPHSTAVDLSGYTIKSGEQLRYSFKLTDLELQPHSYHVLTSQETGLVLANSGGRAALFSPSEKLLFETAVYEDAKTGSTWSKFADDWQWTDQQTPGRKNEKPAAKEDTDKEREQPSDEENVRSFPTLHITELLVDPLAPKTDSNHEFVELYNPNDFAVELKDYVVKTGLPLRYKHTFENGMIEPKTYEVFYSESVSITLANDDGMAALLGGDKELFRSEAYESAPPGASWALINDSWRFTHTPTPGKKNVFTPEESGDVLASSGGSDPPEELSDEEVINALTQPATIPQSRTGTFMVVGLIAIALLYVLYEFRYDIYNRIELTRRYFKARRGDRIET